jgi:toxin YoeB
VRVTFTPRGWADYLYWQQDPDLLTRLNTLIRECQRAPFVGIGKPEPLKGEHSGWWSRRITVEHRLVYRVTGKQGEQQLEIAQCRYHY